MIELHVFTNSTEKNSPNTGIIQRTVESCENTFGLKPTKVWCDPNPNISKSKEYIKKLRSIFVDVEICNSLSDGYINAVKQSSSEYMFMLEHDWVFIPPINPLVEIVSMMDKYGLTHLRFNRYENIAIKVEADYTEDVEGKFCKTHYVSNNPHIIHRERWIEQALPHVKIEPGSLGLEHNLIDKGVNAAIYGPFGYPPTLQHIDGRKKRHRA